MRLAIIIPVYKEIDKLTKFELVSLHKLYNTYIHKYDIYIIHPKGLDIIKYIDTFVCISSIDFDDKWFESEKSYSDFLCTSNIYKELLDLGYSYMFIYQLDALLFYDNMEYFLSLDFDYIGAPWLKTLVGNGVGNGGLCLRKIKPFYDITTNYVNNMINENGHYLWEDQWFCIAHRDKLNIAPPNIAAQFALCSESPEEYFTGTKLPMGAHKLFEHKYQTDFYNKFL